MQRMSRATRHAMAVVKGSRRKNVQLLLNAARDLVSANADKAEVPNAFFPESLLTRSPSPVCIETGFKEEYYQ